MATSISIRAILVFGCLLLMPGFGHADEMTYDLPKLTFERTLTLKDGQPVQQAYPCDDLTIRYWVKNTGSSAIEDAQIMEELPQGVRTAQGEGSISLEIGRIPAGETAVQTVPVKIEEVTVFENDAMVNTPSLRVRSDPARVEILRPELELNLTRQTQDNMTRTETYEISVENTSSDPAREAVVQLDMPEAASNLTVAGGRYELNDNRIPIGRIGAGQEKTFSIEFTRTDAEPISATVSADAYCADRVVSRLETEAVKIPALRIQTIDKTDPVPVGDSTTYEISVKNQGSAEELNIQLTGTIPEEMEFVSGQGKTDVENTGNQVRFGKLETLPPGEMASWQVVVRANETGRVQFELELTSEANPTS
ncbi:MAG: hypothetical protein ACOC0H_04130, partial [Thermodesulfobacteriota bacterium]